MLALTIRFPAGRYHATPWGRHVNEADVEWPPSPWRVIRALTAVWHRKLDPERYPQALLERLVGRLCEAAPVYRLPPATRAHARHYMPVREGKKDKPVLIFDAFVRVPATEQLVIAWPDLVLAAEERDLLAALAWDVGFLGRAESWIEAEVVDDWDGQPNCRPGELSLDPATGELHEPVNVLVPRRDDEYRGWLETTRAGIDWKRLKPKARRELEATLPEDLLGALSLDTAELKRAGWSQPPAGRFVTYQRPHGCFAPSPRVRRAPVGGGVSTLRLVLSGKPLPSIEDAVRIGELVRKALMHCCKSLPGGIPAAVSGHGLDSANRHGHAFYLPEDADGDGHIDHVIVHAELGLNEALPAVSRLKRLYQNGWGEWQVGLEGYGTPDRFPANPHLCSGTTWESVTPYLHPWHAKADFGYLEQVLRECRRRGWPLPEVEAFETIENARGHEYRVLHFHRFRSKRGLSQPDRRGTFLRLRFPEPVQGPVALGFGCHFGLGAFRCIDAREVTAGGTLRTGVG